MGWELVGVADDTVIWGNEGVVGKLYDIGSVCDRIGITGRRGGDDGRETLLGLVDSLRFFVTLVSVGNRTEM